MILWQRYKLWGEKGKLTLSSPSILLCIQTSLRKKKVHKLQLISYIYIYTHTSFCNKPKDKVWATTIVLYNEVVEDSPDISGKLSSPLIFLPSQLYILFLMHP